ncbi:hypothetical protein VULLAG_LOCUS7308 [Vulpes lagopus]
MPRAPQAPATPQPRAAPSARSCGAAAPGMQVSESRTPTPPPAGARPCPSDSAPSAPRPSRRGPPPGLEPPAPRRAFPAVLSIPPRVPTPSCPPGAAVRVPAAASIPPSAQPSAPASFCVGFPFCSRRSLPRSPFADLLVLVSPPAPPTAALQPVRGAGPVGGVGPGPRWGWGLVPPPQGSRPTPSSSPAHNSKG